MRESAVHRAERCGNVGEPLVPGRPGGSWVGGLVEDHEPAVLVLRDARGDPVVHQAFDRAERAVDRREEEGVFDAAPGAEETIDRGLGFTRFVRSDERGSHHADGQPLALLRDPRRLGALMYESHASYSACGLGSDGTDRLVALAREMLVDD